MLYPAEFYLSDGGKLKRREKGREGEKGSDFDFHTFF
jgi:hypothetical protein